MRFCFGLSTGLFCAALTFAQNTETKGLPPRAAPADYQAQAKAGAVTFAADFAGHSVPTGENIYTTEDFVTVELGVFGAADAHAALSAGDFSIRINGKKAPVPSEGFALILKSLKDPDWVPPDTGEGKGKSKGGITGGGDSGGGGDPPPAPPKMPLELQRAMAQKVQKSVLPEGDRALPVAGLLFFPYHGKVDGIRSVELLYSGSAGKATLTLNP